MLNKYLTYEIQEFGFKIFPTSHGSDVWKDIQPHEIYFFDGSDVKEKKGKITFFGFENLKKKL